MQHFQSVSCCNCSPAWSSKQRFASMMRNGTHLVSLAGAQTLGGTHSSFAFHLGLRQSTSSVAVVSNGVSGAVESVSGLAPREASLQTLGFHHIFPPLADAAHDRGN